MAAVTLAGTAGGIPEHEAQDSLVRVIGLAAAEVLQGEPVADLGEYSDPYVLHL